MKRIKRVAIDSDVGREVGLVACDKCIAIARKNLGDSVIRILTYESITIEDSVPCVNCKAAVNSY